MKKILLILCLAPLCFRAQTETEFPAGNFDEMPTLKIRHLKGMHSVDVRYMYAGLGPAYELNYGYLITNKVQFHAGVYYEEAKLGKYTKFNYQNINLGLSYSLFKIKQRIFINPDVSLFAGTLNTKNSDFRVKERYTNFGLSYGLNAECYIFNKVSFIVTADQQFNYKDKFGDFHYNIGGGIRVYLN